MSPLDNNREPNRWAAAAHRFLFNIKDPTISAAILAGVALGMWIGISVKNNTSFDSSLSSRSISPIENKTQQENDDISSVDSYSDSEELLVEEWLRENCQGGSPHVTD